LCNEFDRGWINCSVGEAEKQVSSWIEGCK